METLLSQINNILTTPPGNLIFHLIVAFSIIMTFQSVMIGRRTSRYGYSSRLLWGLGLLLMAQLLFLSSGLAWQGIANPHLFLPPLDRAITVFNLVWITWMWCFPEPNRPADILNGVLNLIIILSLALTLVSWSGQDSTLAFNATWLDWCWQLAAILVSMAAVILLLLRKPENWGIGLSIIIINLLGSSIHLIWIAPIGDFSAPVRLAQLCSFPLLPVLAQRLHTPRVPEKQGQLLPPLQERRRYSADPRAVYAWAQVAIQEEPAHIGVALSHALAQTMLADLCFLVSAPRSQGELIIQCGYDLIREEELAGTTLEQAKIPTLFNAVNRGKPLIINASANSPADIKNISLAIGLETGGNLLHIPLILGTENWGGILFLSPYSNRVWNSNDQDYLTATADTILKILTRKNASDKDTNVSQLREQSEQITTLQNQVAQLNRENQSLQTSLKDKQTVDKDLPDVAALLAVQQESQETINSLRAENERLHAIQDPALFSTTDIPTNDLEGELRLTLEEIARLQNNLAEANSRVLTLENNHNSAGQTSNEDREVINSIAQEIRQPVSSIFGYTDLLLSESAGILGALQRKFLERVKASTERLRSLLDDLIQITSLQDSEPELSSQWVDMSAVIDQAITETSAQIREKKITLRVDLPEELPQIEADRDAIQQIVVHLLQNAGLATPVEGTITLRASIEENQSKSPCLLIQVTDTGGGIASKDIPHVFARRYRAENPLIQGVGDTGVGLSIVKTLVEAHGGRIWVESKSGESSTFSTLLPIQTHQSPSSDGHE